jgi:hypothetical protein
MAGIKFLVEYLSLVEEDDQGVATGSAGSSKTSKPSRLMVFECSVLPGVGIGVRLRWLRYGSGMRTITPDTKEHKNLADITQGVSL